MPLPSGASKWSISSARAATAPTGSPPPIHLPRQVMSASIPKRSAEPPSARRNIRQSSSTNSTPASRASALSAGRNPSGGGVTTPVYCTGSTITAATSPAWRSNTCA